MKFRRPAIHFILALLLLLTQQLSMSHAIGHLTHPVGADQSRTASEKQLPGELQCAKCLAFAAIGSALHGTAPTIIADAAVGHSRDVVLTSPRLRPSFPAFYSRAPPVIS